MLSRAQRLPSGSLTVKSSSFITQLKQNHQKFITLKEYEYLTLENRILYTHQSYTNSGSVTQFQFQNELIITSQSLFHLLVCLHLLINHAKGVHRGVTQGWPHFTGSKPPSLQCAIYNTKTVFMLKMGSFSVMIPVDGSDNSENAFNCKQQEILKI